MGAAAADIRVEPVLDKKGLKQFIHMPRPLYADDPAWVAPLDFERMGVLDKVYLLFEEVFWDRDATWIATPENGLPRGQFNQWVNFYPALGAPLLMAFNGGPPALDLARMPDEAVIRRALDTLDRAYPA